MVIGDYLAVEKETAQSVKEMGISLRTTILVGE